MLPWLHSVYARLLVLSSINSLTGSVLKTVVQPPPSGHLFLEGGIVLWMLMLGIHSISAKLSPFLLPDSIDMFDLCHFSIY